MLSMRSGSILAVLLASTCSIAGAQNLVRNGEFESPVISTCFVHVPAGSTMLDEWQIEAPSVGLGIDIISRPFCGPGIAHCEAQAVDMAGTPGRGSIYQDLDTTPGATYALTFYVSGIGNYASALTVEWDGTAIDTIGNPAAPEWRLITYSVTATAAVTRLKFIGNFDGLQGAFLDSIVVDPSNIFPCPGDIDGDRSVGLSDLATLLSHFGETSGATEATGDLDCDADVDLTDLARMLSAFGTVCP